MRVLDRKSDAMCNDINAIRGNCTWPTGVQSLDRSGAGVGALVQADASVQAGTGMCLAGMLMVVALAGRQALCVRDAGVMRV